MNATALFKYRLQRTANRVLEFNTQRQRPSQALETLSSIMPV